MTMDADTRASWPPTPRLQRRNDPNPVEDLSERVDRWRPLVAFGLSFVVGGLVVTGILLLAIASEGRAEGRALGFIVGSWVYLAAQCVLARVLATKFASHPAGARQMSEAAFIAAGFLAFVVFVVGAANG
jgi:hypothetical protein